jgi:hypothetical protein
VRSSEEAKVIRVATILLFAIGSTVAQNVATMGR